MAKDITADDLALLDKLGVEAERLQIDSRSAREQRIIALEYDGTIQSGLADFVAIDQYAPAIGMNQPVNDPQQRRLSASAWADDRRERPAPNLKSHVGKRGHFQHAPMRGLVKALVNALDLQFWRACHAGSPFFPQVGGVHV